MRAVKKVTCWFVFRRVSADWQEGECHVMQKWHENTELWHNEKQTNFDQSKWKCRAVMDYLIPWKLVLMRCINK